MAPAVVVPIVAAVVVALTAVFGYVHYSLHESAEAAKNEIKELQTQLQQKILEVAAANATNKAKVAALCLEADETKGELFRLMCKATDGKYDFDYGSRTWTCTEARITLIISHRPSASCLAP